MPHELVRQHAGHAFDRERERNVLYRRQMTHADEHSDHAGRLFRRHFFFQIVKAGRRIAKAPRHGHYLLRVRRVS